MRLAERPKTIGGAGRHLSMMFDQEGVKIRTVAFGGGDWEEELAAIDGEMSIAFRPVINRYRGRSSWKSTSPIGGSTPPDTVARPKVLRRAWTNRLQRDHAHRSTFWACHPQICLGCYHLSAAPRDKSRSAFTPNACFRMLPAV